MKVKKKLASCTRRDTTTPVLITTNLPHYVAQRVFASNLCRVVGDMQSRILSYDRITASHTGFFNTYFGLRCDLSTDDVAPHVGMRPHYFLCINIKF